MLFDSILLIIVVHDNNIIQQLQMANMTTITLVQTTPRQAHKPSSGEEETWRHSPYADTS